MADRVQDSGVASRQEARPQPGQGVAANFTSIAATFAAALIPVEPVQVEALACHLNAVGGELERVIGELMHSDLPASQSGLLIALAYKDALKCEADPLYLAKRLRRSADDIDYRAEKLVAEGADAAGRGRLAEAQACADLVADFTREACDKRMAAAEIERRERRQDDLGGAIFDMLATTNAALAKAYGGRAA